MEVASPFLDFETLLYRVAAFVLVVTLHDFMQGALALAFGDRTAKEQGRVTLNPAAHLDFLGLAMILFGPYGWGRPVPVTPANFRKSPRLSTWLVYGMGPILYFLLGLLFWWLYFAVPFEESGPATWAVLLLKETLHYCFIVSILLCILNLLPLYPMDAAKAILVTAGKPAEERKGAFAWGSFFLLTVMLVTPLGQHYLEAIFRLFSQWIMHSYAI
ncbi:hypothetical protein MJA45_17050 [Paenibacillus aurantius]|uniref:Site-2 protease family protein n=1 Tax=Paenibacillus aurantius TaxID=2918900 RepID=A0AA96LA38_9BACL|nr:hypothetical protein [Paenibacillus aurantius]WNQ09334.1 hypothetical protein MJA45_17050 [Paenibacillus aurantius]